MKPNNIKFPTAMKEQIYMYLVCVQVNKTEKLLPEICHETGELYIKMRWAHANSYLKYVQRENWIGNYIQKPHVFAHNNNKIGWKIAFPLVCIYFTNGEVLLRGAQTFSSIKTQISCTTRLLKYFRTYIIFRIYCENSRDKKCFVWNNK